ncbi:hypothetical protein HCN44_003646 [Aphidius gifuensis]|uniref:Cadherin domain-containing protein n=1 Tax=Aphidius gifuensis TaxID=684658 RepID=A0A835CN52_APHGI|nr:DE-cadherin-like [Aphidius gifuensis]KAF7987783.1 hypothetical protein HCN44_003646 [Aphidius gifuensis]
MQFPILIVGLFFFIGSGYGNDDFQDEKIHFEKSLYTVNDLFDTTNINDVIVKVKAVSSSSPVTYEITSGNLENSFRINNETGEIFVNEFIDYSKFQQYNLTVTAYDDADSDYTTVQIFLKEYYPSSVTIEAGKEYYDCLVQFQTSKTKNKSNETFEIINEIQKAIFTIDNHGCLILKEPIYQDPESGKLSWNLRIVHTVHHSAGISTEMSLLEVNVIVPNENGPFLSKQTIYWDEKQNAGVIIKLSAIDSQSPGPFNYEIDNDEVDAKTKESFDIVDYDDLYATVTFNHAEQSQYKIPIIITDIVDPSRRGKSYLFVEINQVEDDQDHDDFWLSTE